MKDKKYNIEQTFKRLDNIQKKLKKIANQIEFMSTDRW